jgi:ubiquinone/menaquinone biosynthesis C-methylase UbiE
MPKTDPYDGRAEGYDRWYDEHKLVYEAELEAVGKLVPQYGTGLEIGIGTGRFARPLNISHGVEPSKDMRAFARSLGLDVVGGAAESLPYDDAQFDFALMVTVLHLLDDADAAMRECYRVVKAGGCLIIGFIDRDSPVGKKYSSRKDEDSGSYFAKARFYTPEEVIAMLEKAGFSDFEFYQTLFRDMESIDTPEPVKPGYGEGSFVVVKAKKQ